MMAIWLGGIPLIAEKVSGLRRVTIDQYIEENFWEPQTPFEMMALSWVLLKEFCPKEADVIIKTLLKGVKFAEDEVDITQHENAVLFCVAQNDIARGTHPGGQLISTTPVIKIGNDIHDAAGSFPIDHFRKTIAELGSSVAIAIPFERNARNGFQ